MIYNLIFSEMSEDEQFALALKMSEQEARQLNSQEEEEEELLRKAIAESLSVSRRDVLLLFLFFFCPVGFRNDFSPRLAYETSLGILLFDEASDKRANITNIFVKLYCANGLIDA